MSRRFAGMGNATEMGGGIVEESGGRGSGMREKGGKGMKRMQGSKRWGEGKRHPRWQGQQSRAGGQGGERRRWRGTRTTGTKVGSMAWKFCGIWVPCRGKTPNLTSMAWKNGEFGFHGVEVFQNDNSPCGGRGQGGRRGFPRCGKLASMLWKNGFHGMEKRQKWVPWRGTFCGAMKNDDSSCGRGWRDWRGRGGGRPWGHSPIGARESGLVWGRDCGRIGR